MKQLFIIAMVLFLSGCINLGRIGIHPELKTMYLDGHKNALEDCLYSAALTQHLSMIANDPLTEGTDRYNLQDAKYEDAAWIDISAFGNNQTSISFFYAPNDPDIHKAILFMISQCEHKMAD